MDQRGGVAPNIPIQAHHDDYDDSDGSERQPCRPCRGDRPNNNQQAQRAPQQQQLPVLHCSRRIAKDDLRDIGVTIVPEDAEGELDLFAQCGIRPQCFSTRITRSKLVWVVYISAQRSEQTLAAERRDGGIQPGEYFWKLQIQPRGVVHPHVGTLVADEIERGTRMACHGRSRLAPLAA